MPEFLKGNYKVDTKIEDKGDATDSIDGFANAEENQPRIRRSVLELAESQLGSGVDAIVVGAGPSLHKRRSLERLHASGFGGTIVAADGALRAFLHAGVVPHVVVSVD